MRYVIIAAVMLLSCSAPKDIQIEEVSVTLVEIEKIYRAGSPDGYILYWEDKHGVRYTQFSANGFYELGTRIKIFMRR